MLHKLISEYLEYLSPSGDSGFVSEYQISSSINQILKTFKNYQPTFEDLAEQIAFGFVENYTNKETGWGTYYGPMMVFPNDQNQSVEYPSIQKIDLVTLNYWKKRSKEAENPVLSARYADLVVDFNKKITSKNPKEIVDLVLIVINSNLEICDKLLLDPCYCKIKIKRCLDLALKFKANSKINLGKIIEKIINLEDKIGIDGKPGLWGFSFEWLVLDKKISLLVDENTKNNLVQNLETRLERIKGNPQLAEHAIRLLADFYSIRKDVANLTRILKVFEISYKSDARLNSEPILQTHAYQEIREIYEQYRDKGYSEFKNNVETITKEINNLDLEWSKSLKKIETSIDIPTEVIQDFIDSIFDVTNIPKEDELRVILKKTIANFLPKKEELEKQFKISVNDSTILYMATNHIISDEGFVTGTIVGIDKVESDQKHFIRNSAQNLNFYNYFLGIVLNKLKSEYNVKQVIEILQSSVIFSDENEDYLNTAIEAFWQNNFIVSSHLFIPIIEAGIRKLVKLTGGNYLSFISANGGYQVKTLSTLFREYDKVIDSVFSILDTEVSFYLKLVLTENFGYNFRNDFAHGINKKQFFSQQVSDRLFHIILLLSIVEITHPPLPI